MLFKPFSLQFCIFSNSVEQTTFLRLSYQTSNIHCKVSYSLFQKVSCWFIGHFIAYVHSLLCSHHNESDFMSKYINIGLKDSDLEQNLKHQCWCNTLYFRVFLSMTSSFFCLYHLNSVTALHADWHLMMSLTSSCIPSYTSVQIRCSKLVNFAKYDFNFFKFYWLQYSASYNYQFLFILQIWWHQDQTSFFSNIKYTIDVNTWRIEWGKLTISLFHVKRA